jgi:centromeric protein E
LGLIRLLLNCACTPDRRSSRLSTLHSLPAADGVTSSGKTHTMMGTDEVPGIVPYAIAEVFDTIARTPGKEFLLRISMMEIYNEVGRGGRSSSLAVGRE